MHPIVRLVGIGAVVATAAVAWLVLGGVMGERTRSKSRELQGSVSELWGAPQGQLAPSFTFHWVTRELETRTVVEDGHSREVREWSDQWHDRAMQPSSSALEVDLDLDARRKGLMWYALYDVDFAGAWTYTHEETIAGTLDVALQFPDQAGLYDGFRFVVDGEDLARTLRPEGGVVRARVPVEPGQQLTLEVAYRSRGMDEWRYVPASGVANLEDFSLAMTTDFTRIDFPAYSMSPSSRQLTDEGWTLDWTFDQIVTGHDIGMVMPVPVQPGMLAAQLSFSAPISLLFFVIVLFVLSVMRGIEIHPINYLFLAAAFFAFHLLFAYTVDHIEVVTAFALCSAVSVVLVVSYLRLVVSNRFAFVEAAAAQLIYLVGFALAHFWDGFTGLTVTVLAIVTLFLLMQLTGRLRWSQVLSRTVPVEQPAR